MAKSYNIPVTQNIKTPSASFANADGTTAKTLYTASVDDAVLKSIMASSTDGTARNFKLILNQGGSDRCIGCVNIPANAGTNGTAAAVDLLNSTSLPGLPVDQNSKRVLPLQGGTIVKLQPLVAVTAAAAIDFAGVAEEY